MTCCFAFVLTLALYGDVLATYSGVWINGSGPVYSPVVTADFTGNATVKISNHNNLNVGFDLYDRNTGTVVANGTVKDKGEYRYIATFIKGRKYQLRLRCQEPVWNRTKCNAYGWFYQ